jgi:hypothetical protein
MTPRDRVLRTLNHQSIDRAPRDAWLLPGVEADRADDVAETNVRFPGDILHLDTKAPAGRRTKGAANRSGHFTDAWGCAWQLGHRGAAGPLVESPLADASKVATYEPPTELLDAARFAKIGRTCHGTTQFTLAWSDVRPLDRLNSLRGTEAAVNELNGGSQELCCLLKRLDEHFCRELELWSGTDVDGVVLGDDLGWSGSPRISPKTWRNLFRPLYREYCDILRSHDKFVFFHSGGQIADVLDDLIDVGIDAIHAQFFQMNFEALAERHRGRVTFWGDFGHKLIEPTTTAEEVRGEVLRARKALDFGAGGVVAQCSWGPATPIRNIATFFEEWMVPLPVTV